MSSSSIELKGHMGEPGLLALAQLAVLGAAISYAFAGVYGRQFSSMSIDPIISAASQVTMSSVILIPISLALSEHSDIDG